MSGRHTSQDADLAEARAQRAERDAARAKEIRGHWGRGLSAQAIAKIVHADPRHVRKVLEQQGVVLERRRTDAW